MKRKICRLGNSSRARGFGTLVTLFLLGSITTEAQISTKDLVLEGSTGAGVVTVQAPSAGTAYQYVFPSTTAVNGIVGAISYISSTSGTQASASWLVPALDGQVLQLVGGLPAWVTLPQLPTATGTGSTLYWNGTDWVENANVLLSPTGSITAAGDLTVTGSNVTLPAGSISNTELANSSITVTTGTGLSGGGTVPLGGTVTLVNSGVTSITGTANQVTTSGSTGAVSLSLPQNIHTGATPTFSGLTLNGLSNDNTIGLIAVVDGNGNLKTRSLTSLPTGFSGVWANSTLVGNGLLAALGLNLANANSWSAVQTFANAVINGGAINGTTIGATTPSTGTFTLLNSTGNTTLGNGGDNITLNATGGSLNLTGLSLNNAGDRVLVQNAAGQVSYRDASTFTGTADWKLAGNTGTNPAADYIGTGDGQPLVVRTDGVERARFLASGPMQVSSSAGSTAEIRLMEPTTGGSEYTSFSARPQTQTIRYSLPDTAGKHGDILQVKSFNTTTKEMVLDWAEPNVSGATGSILFARKAVDDTATTTTPATLRNDPELFLTLAANTSYKIEATLYVYQLSTSTAAIDIAIDAPTGAVMQFSLSGFEAKNGNSNTGNGFRDADNAGSTTSSAYNAIGLSSTNIVIIQLKGMIITGSTGGDAKLKWIGTSNNDRIRVRRNSIFMAQVVE